MNSFESKIIPWVTSGPFIVHFSNGGEIHFYKDGRTVGKLSNPDDAADEFVKFVEQHYRAHILEAERRAEQRVRAEIGRDSERLDWLLARAHYGIPGFDPCVRGRTPEKRRADLLRAIDAAREVGE